MSYIKAIFLIFCVMSLAASAGWMIGGYTGVILSVISITMLHLFILWKADRILIHLHKARKIHDDDTSPVLRAVLNDCRMLARRAEITPPQIYLIESDQPNAFAAGHDPSHAALLFTSGLFTTLSRDEARAIISHELTHIKHGDSLPMGIAAALGSLLSRLFWLAGMPFGKADTASRIGAGIVTRLACDRLREYRADRNGAKLCGNPMQMASALEKLERGATSTLNHFAEQYPAIAHLYVIDPLNQNRSFSASHPPTTSRIAKLKKQAAQTSKTCPLPVHV